LKTVHDQDACVALSGVRKPCRTDRVRYLVRVVPVNLPITGAMCSDSRSSGFAITGAMADHQAARFIDPGYA
jgi:hypothetical protein